MIDSKTVLKSGLVLLMISIGLAVSHYHCKATHSRIESFVYEQDAQDVIELFRQDNEWLTTRTFDASHVDWTLKTHSPNEYEPEYQGMMNIDVIRDQNRVAGFVTYYFMSPIVGRILFLEIGKEFRCRGYGELLVRHAIQYFFNKGISLVQLLTRETNYPAQRLYTRVGFQEISRSQGFIYYAITPQTLQPYNAITKTASSSSCTATT